MEAAGLCFLLSRLLLLASRLETSDADFAAVTARLQYFQYESVSFGCEGVNGSARLRGIRNAEGFLAPCDLRGPWRSFSCTVETAYPGDSGCYWCETETGERSSAVDVSVTAGPVILVSPALPVTEGVNVTLRCRHKVSSGTTAQFYKDGRLIGSSSTGEMSVHSVSKSDQGLYKCSISGAGESPQSWLAVRDDLVVLLGPVLPVAEGVNVTLLCHKNRISPNFTAHFYRDGVFLRSSSTGHTTVHSVSKADEGFYTCSVSGAGESAQSWLAVQAHHRDACSSSGLMHLFIVLRVGLIVVMVALLLGLIHCSRARAT